MNRHEYVFGVHIKCVFSQTSVCLQFTIWKKKIKCYILTDAYPKKNSCSGVAGNPGKVFLFDVPSSESAK